MINLAYGYLALLLFGLLALFTRARGALLGYLITSASLWLGLAAALTGARLLSAAGAPGSHWLQAGLIFGFVQVLSLLLSRLMPALRQRLADRALLQAVIAALFSSLLLPLGVLGGIYAYGNSRQQAERRHSAELYQPEGELDPNALTEYGVPVPSGFTQPEVWRNSYGPRHVGVDDTNWEQYPDLLITIYHQQAGGYQGGSELALTPWDLMTERAAQELCRGLRAAGWTLYQGRGLKERWNGNGPWVSYYEPVIVGVRDGATLHCRIVPDPRILGAGSAPELQIGIYTRQPKQVFKWSQKRNGLQPLAPDKEQIFETIDGYLK